MDMDINELKNGRKDSDPGLETGYEIWTKYNAYTIKEASAKQDLAYNHKCQKVAMYQDITLSNHN